VSLLLKYASFVQPCSAQARLQQHTLLSPQSNALLLQVKFITVVKSTNKTKQFVFPHGLQFSVLAVSHDVVNYGEGYTVHVRTRTQ
jgi:hypothetical protein